MTSNKLGGAQRQLRPAFRYSLRNQHRNGEFTKEEEYMTYTPLQKAIHRLFGEDIPPSSFSRVERRLLANDPTVPMTPQEREESLARLRHNRGRAEPRNLVASGVPGA